MLVTCGGARTREGRTSSRVSYSAASRDLTAHTGDDEEASTRGRLLPSPAVAPQRSSVHHGAMSAPREHVVGQILALGTEEVPFTFAPSADGVTGAWDYADARWVGLASAGTIDRDYRLEVSLHDDSTYTFVDHGSATQTRVGAGGASVSTSMSRGTVRSKSFRKSFAPLATDHGQTGHSYGWRFDPDEMREPVRQVLEQSGWTARRRGIWGRLTGRR